MLKINKIAQVVRQVFSVFCKIEIRLSRLLSLFFLIICIIIIYIFDFINKFIV